MSQTFIRESFAVVARYVPQRDTANEESGAEGWASILTTGVEPILGVHMATSPLPWPVSITPFIRFYRMQVGYPRFVFASPIT